MSKEGFKCKYYDICNVKKKDKCFDYILNNHCKILNHLEKTIINLIERCFKFRYSENDIRLSLNEMFKERIVSKILQEENNQNKKKVHWRLIK